MVYTYKHDLAGFRNVVNHKFLLQISIPDQSNYHGNNTIQQVRGMSVYVDGVAEEVVYMEV